MNRSDVLFGLPYCSLAFGAILERLIVTLEVGSSLRSRNRDQFIGDERKCGLLFP